MRFQTEQRATDFHSANDNNTNQLELRDFNSQKLRTALPDAGYDDHEQL